MKRILILALLMFSAAACQKGNEILDGPKERYDYIYVHTGGALIEAHNSTLNCSKKATTMELEIISFMGAGCVSCSFFCSFCRGLLYL